MTGTDKATAAPIARPPTRSPDRALRWCRLVELVRSPVSTELAVLHLRGPEERLGDVELILAEHVHGIVAPVLRRGCPQTPDSGIGVWGAGDLPVVEPSCPRSGGDVSHGIRRFATTIRPPLFVNGALLEGDLAPIQAAVLAMHTAIYAWPSQTSRRRSARAFLQCCWLSLDIPTGTGRGSVDAEEGRACSVTGLRFGVPVGHAYEDALKGERCFEVWGERAEIDVRVEIFGRG